MNFAEFLAEYLIPYRHDIMAQYKTSPLLLGGAGRQFSVFTPVFQVLGVGPMFLPVPGGAFSDQQNQVKFPASTRNIDVLESWENNLALGPLGTSCGGVRVAQGHEWHVDSVTLGAGGGDVIVGGPNRVEIKINSMIINPDTLGIVQHLTFIFAASAGAIIGHIQNLEIFFLFDNAAPAYESLDNMIQIFPHGLRMECDTAGADIVVGIAGGSGNENTVWNYEWRNLD